MGAVYSTSIFVGILVCILISPPRSLTQVNDSGADQAPGSYRIHQGEKLSHKFFSPRELNRPAQRVRPDRFIIPQTITEIDAAGRTFPDLKADRERSYNV